MLLGLLWVALTLQVYLKRTDTFQVLNPPVRLHDRALPSLTLVFTFVFCKRQSCFHYVWIIRALSPPSNFYTFSSSVSLACAAGSTLIPSDSRGKFHYFANKYDACPGFVVGVLYWIDEVSQYLYLEKKSYFPPHQLSSFITWFFSAFIEIIIWWGFFFSPCFFLMNVVTWTDWLFFF